ncbi:MAG: C13 family peptidase [Geminicoccaceae bacterium]
MTKAITDIAARCRPNDEVFILLIGHGSFDGKQAAFNLPGPDLTAGDFAELLSKLASQRVVFVNTASSSGPFVDALKGPGRTIVTATKTGGERNEPRFPAFFVEAFQHQVALADARECYPFFRV